MLTSDPKRHFALRFWAWANTRFAPIERGLSLAMLLNHETHLRPWLPFVAQCSHRTRFFVGAMLVIARCNACIAITYKTRFLEFSREIDISSHVSRRRLFVCKRHLVVAPDSHKGCPYINPPITMRLKRLNVGTGLVPVRPPNSLENHFSGWLTCAINPSGCRKNAMCDRFASLKNGSRSNT
jgi:hypothetical protein